VESEATTALAMRLARAYDEAREDADAGRDDSDAQLFKRLATAVGKYWSCKRSPNHAFESLECLGGAGYIEESGMPRLYREAPLASIWEGSGNVMSLDVLRALAREPEGLPAFLAECELARGADARLDAHLDALPASLGALAGPDAQWLARRAVEDLAVAFQASLLVRTAPPAVADAFCAGRLGDARGRVFGTLPAGIDAEAILERALAI
jgi:putative acyl-CoA dehydrogenase